MTRPGRAQGERRRARIASTDVPKSGAAEDARGLDRGGEFGRRSRTGSNPESQRETWGGVSTPGVHLAAT